MIAPGDIAPRQDSSRELYVVVLSNSIHLAANTGRVITCPFIPGKIPDDAMAMVVKTNKVEPADGACDVPERVGPVVAELVGVRQGAGDRRPVAFGQLAHVQTESVELWLVLEGGGIGDRDLVRGYDAGFNAHRPPWIVGTDFGMSRDAVPGRKLDAVAVEHRHEAHFRVSPIARRQLVAGPREEKRPGIYALALSVLDRCMASQEEKA